MNDDPMYHCDKEGQYFMFDKIDMKWSFRRGFAVGVIGVVVTFILLTLIFG